jgi:next-to-BRCA1 protein 1
MLKMKTSDTVIPTVYRVGQINIIPCRQEETSRPSPALPVDNEKQVDVLPSTQEPAVKIEMPPSASSATGFTLPPLGLDPRSDIFREFWPKINDEFKAQILDPNTNQVTQVADAQATPVDSADTSMTMMNPFQDPEPKSMPEVPAEVPLASTQPVVEIPDMSQHTMIPVSTLNQSLAVLLDEYNSLTSGVASPFSTSDNSLLTMETSSPRANDLSCRLEATFVMDCTVPDGQIFPPGAEFVKSWRMMNSGDIDWPETTELRYVSGEKFSLDLHSDSSTVEIGDVTAGTEVQVWTAELKAPDTPGTYRSYWRLNDGKGNDFGHTLWVEITVVESIHLLDGPEGSLASSSVIMMPQSAASAHSTIASDVALRSAFNRPSSRTATSKPSIDITTSGSSSPDSSISLISLPVSSEDDDWEESRSRIVTRPQSPREAAEYVVLYETSSDEE